MKPIVMTNRSPGGRPLIGVAIGDPSGVGAEILVKALQTREPQRDAGIMLIGNLDALEHAARVCGSDVTFTAVSGPAEARTFANGAIPVFDDGTLTMADYTIGAPSAKGGRATFDWILQAIDWASDGSIDGYITAPVDSASFKLAGVALGERAHPPGTYLLRCSGNLRFVPIGEHVMMRDVPPSVTTDAVAAVIRLVAEQLKRWGMAQPRIAVAGLNPHCAGVEDKEQIAPAVELTRAEGYDVTGPLSPDTVFRRALQGDHDVVVAMYHDQGQIAIKTTGLEAACAIFIGLPYVRVGVPHGSAFDIAGKNLAQPGTMLTALKTAARLASGRGL
jgi:4-phospho-D-threonate 3-dehydrogenase / 4-phospho-D-erythronate 3-dehydrogenase